MQVKKTANVPELHYLIFSTSWAKVKLLLRCLRLCFAYRYRSNGMGTDALIRGVIRSISSAAIWSLLYASVYWLQKFRATSK